jgi:hypothetical protein
MGNRESSPPSQPCDEMLASFLCRTNISDSLTARSVSPLQFRSNDSLTPVLEEDRLDEIHTDFSAKIITEKMLIEIYNENNGQNNKTNQNHNIFVVRNNDRQISGNQNKENVSPSNVCSTKNFLSSNRPMQKKQSLLGFILNGLGPIIR